MLKWVRFLATKTVRGEVSQGFLVFLSAVYGISIMNFQRYLLPDLMGIQYWKFLDGHSIGPAQLSYKDATPQSSTTTLNIEYPTPNNEFATHLATASDRHSIFLVSIFDYDEYRISINEC